MKKVLILSRDFGHLGGVVSYINLLIKNFPKEEFEIKHFVQGRNPTSWKNIFLPFMLLYQLIIFKKMLKKFKPDVIHINPSFHVHSLLRDAFYLGIVHKSYFKNTLVMFHGWDNYLAERIANKSFYKNLFNKTYGKARLILTLCKHYQKQLVKMGISPEKLIVTTTMYQGVLNIGRQKHNNLNKKINILFMSRFVKEKGVYIAAEAARLLVENGYKDFCFVFAGDGPEYKGLTDYIKEYRLNDYIRALGYVKGERKREILKNCDILLFPTWLDEGCPMVLLEAIGAGLAIITTPMGAIPDIVEHNKNGFIIESKDPKKFYKAVKKLIEDRESLRRIQKSNMEKAEENYEVKVVTKKMESIYLSIIN